MRKNESKSEHSSENQM